MYRLEGEISLFWEAPLIFIHWGFINPRRTVNSRWWFVFSHIFSLNDLKRIFSRWSLDFWDLSECVTLPHDFHSTNRAAGDVISLRPGEECPADGVVTRGSASCSEAVPWFGNKNGILVESDQSTDPKQITWGCDPNQPRIARFLWLDLTFEEPYWERFQLAIRLS